MDVKSRGSALGEILNLFREFFNFLGLFDDGHGKCGSGIRFIHLTLEIGGHFIEFGDVLPESFLIRALDGLRIWGAWLLQVRRSIWGRVRWGKPWPSGQFPNLVLAARREESLRQRRRQPQPIPLTSGVLILALVTSVKQNPDGRTASDNAFAVAKLPKPTFSPFFGVSQDAK